MLERNLTFTALRTANDDRDQEYDPQGKCDLLYFSNSLGGEVGEAQNLVTKIIRERLGLPGSRTTMARLAEELADVVIYADLLASHAGIDLGQAIREKFNQTSRELGFKRKL